MGNATYFLFNLNKGQSLSGHGEIIGKLYFTAFAFTLLCSLSQ